MGRFTFSFDHSQRVYMYIHSNVKSKLKKGNKVENEREKMEKYKELLVKSIFHTLMPQLMLIYILKNCFKYGCSATKREFKEHNLFVSVSSMFTIVTVK